MIECNSIEVPSIYSNLNDQQQFRLYKISEVRDYFIAEIRERELMSKMLSKYIASFDCFEKFLIILSATSGSIFVASFATVIGAPVGIESANVSLAFSMSIGLKKVKEKALMKLLEKKHK